MPIHILAPEVANQIAAGEVVERPASAVKERVHRKSVGCTVAEPVEAPPFDKLRVRRSPTVLRYTLKELIEVHDRLTVV